jgi:hypothetical protein
MRNPWEELPTEPPFVLHADRPLVEEFNQRVRPEQQLALHLIPQPFLGNREAPLVVLGANPNIRGGHSAGPVAAAIQANLGPDPQRHLLIGLLPEFEQTPNADWWRRDCLRELLDRGLPPRWLASHILAVELHGYHSRKWRRPSVPFPSQRYGFWLVERAIDRGATIVPTSCQRHWETFVPRLASYPHRVVKKNRRSRSKRVSEGNLGYEGFDTVLRALAE